MVLFCFVSIIKLFLSEFHLGFFQFFPHWGTGHASSLTVLSCPLELNHNSEKILCSIKAYLVDEAQVYALEKVSFHSSVHC